MVDLGRGGGKLPRWCAGGSYTSWALTAAARDLISEFFCHLLAFALAVVHFPTVFIDKGHTPVEGIEALARLLADTFYLTLARLLLLLSTLCVLALNITGSAALARSLGSGAINRVDGLQFVGDILSLGLCWWSVAKMHTAIFVDPTIQFTGIGTDGQEQAGEGDCPFRSVHGAFRIHRLGALFYLVGQLAEQPPRVALGDMVGLQYQGLLLAGFGGIQHHSVA